MFNRTERLILKKLFEISDKLGLDGDNKKYVEILEQGYELKYEEIFQSIDEEILTSDDCEFVSHVIIMYDCMAKVYKLGNKGEKDKKPIFFGFSGNDETKLMSYTRFILSEPSKFSALKSLNSEHHGGECDWDSHFPVKNLYKKQLEKFISLAETKYGPITPEGVQEVLNVKVQGE